MWRAVAVVGAVLWIGQSCVSAQLVRPAIVAPATRPRLSMKAAEAWSLRIEDGKLVVKTSAEATETASSRLLKLDDLPGSGTIMHSGDRLRISYSMPTVDGKSTMLRVDQRPGYLLLTHRTSSAAKMLEVTLIQGSPVVGAAAQPVEGLTIRIRETNPQTGQVVQDVEMVGKDIRALRREHDREMRETVGPALRVFGMRGDLGADEVTARRALLDPKPKAEIEAAVAKLVEKLDADAFTEREAASEQLKKMGPDAAEALRALDAKKFTPQQKVMIDAILAASGQPAAVDVARLRKDKDFLLDCLYCEDAEVRQAALGRLGELLGKKVEFDLTLEGEKREAAVEALRDQASGGR